MSKITYLSVAGLIDKIDVFPRTRQGRNSFIKKSGFPKPYYFNSNTPVWSEQEVDDWLTNRPRNHFDAKQQSQKHQSLTFINYA